MQRQRPIGLVTLFCFL